MLAANVKDIVPVGRSPESYRERTSLPTALISPHRLSLQVYGRGFKEVGVDRRSHVREKRAPAESLESATAASVVTPHKEAEKCA